VLEGKVGEGRQGCQGGHKEGRQLSEHQLGDLGNRPGSALWAAARQCEALVKTPRWALRIAHDVKSIEIYIVQDAVQTDHLGQGMQGMGCFLP